MRYAEVAVLECPECGVKWTTAVHTEASGAVTYRWPSHAVCVMHDVEAICHTIENKPKRAKQKWTQPELPL